MRIVVSLAASLVVATALFAVEDDSTPPPKRHGGFTGATPKPVVKKSAAAKKAASDDDADSSDAAAKKSPAKKSATSESTPAPKKKSKQPDDSPADEKKSAAPEASAKSASATDATSDATTSTKREHAPAATVAPEDIVEFAAQPPRIQSLIKAALELPKLNLTYTYGSADPAQGGMDCSGTIYYLLRSQGFKDVPRDSSGQYVWVRKAGLFSVVVSKSAESFEFKDLLPGDLMFWTGTYETGREIPISHVMLYLGTEKKSKKRIMFGSSDGRSYDGVQRWGVSVFDFKMPRNDSVNSEKSKVDFVGYGRIPTLREQEVAEVKASPSTAKKEPEETTVAEATPRPKTSTSRRKH